MNSSSIPEDLIPSPVPKDWDEDATKKSVHHENTSSWSSPTSCIPGFGSGDSFDDQEPL